MKIATILLLCSMLSCKQSTWKELENTDYNKDSIVYDCDYFYLFKRGPHIVLTFESGWYDTSCIKKYLPGVVRVSYHKAWIDSSRFDLDKTKQYFSTFTNRRIL